jgi:hypothetical protein
VKNSENHPEIWPSMPATACHGLPPQSADLDIAELSRILEILSLWKKSLKIPGITETAN